MNPRKYAVMLNLFNLLVVSNLFTALNINSAAGHLFFFLPNFNSVAKSDNICEWMIIQNQMLPLCKFWTLQRKACANGVAVVWESAAKLQSHLFLTTGKGFHKSHHFFATLLTFEGKNKQLFLQENEHFEERYELDRTK